MAVRPLSLSELSAAIGNTPSVACDEVTRDQVSYCGCFLTMKGDEVGFVHQSAKDYLLRETCDPVPAQEAFRVKIYTGSLVVTRKCM